MKLKVKPLRKDVKLPVRANPTDAGLDVFWNPSYTPDIGIAGIGFDGHVGQFYAHIEPGKNLLLRVGIAVEFPDGYAMEVKNRSSMGSNRSLVVGAHLIDSSYRGEIFIDLHNIGKKMQTLHDGDKIAQLVIYPIETPEIEIVEELSETVRGEGGFGSTGK